jgi:hypothetical protein
MSRQRRPIFFVEKVEADRPDRAFTGMSQTPLVRRLAAAGVFILILIAG